MSVEAVEPAGLVQKVLMLSFTSSVFLGTLPSMPHITTHPRPMLFHLESLLS